MPTILHAYKRFKTLKNERIGYILLFCITRRFLYQQCVAPTLLTVWCLGIEKQAQNVELFLSKSKPSFWQENLAITSFKPTEKRAD